MQPCTIGADFNLFYGNSSVAKTKQLEPNYTRGLLQTSITNFLDAGLIVKVNHIDGIHIERDSIPIFLKLLPKKLMTWNLSDLRQTFK